MRIGISGSGGAGGARGGVEVFLRDLLQALAEHGHPDHEYVVFVAASEEPPPMPASGRMSLARLKSDLPPRRPLSELLRFGLRRRPAPGEMGREIDGLDLDVVHFPVTRMPPLRVAAPVVLTFFDMQEEFLPRFFPMRERLGRFVANRRGVREARLVLVPSRFTGECLRLKYDVPEAKIVVTPVGVSPRFHARPGEGERRRLQERYAVPTGDFLFYPANPWPHKNHARLFASLARLRRFPSLVVPLVCTGRLAGEGRSASRLAEEAGLPAAQVQDLGYVASEDLPALYRAARALVFPSLFEGFGIPVLEAMASGCPVACARTTALPEVGGDAARYFDPTCEQAIADAIADIWTDDRLRADLVRRGLERAESFRWPQVIPRVVEAYDRLA